MTRVRLQERNWIHVNPSKKGMFNGRTLGSLEKQKDSIEGEHKDTKMHELEFAIRAKKGHGFSESIDTLWMKSAKNKNHIFRGYKNNNLRIEPGEHGGHDGYLNATKVTNHSDIEKVKKHLENRVDGKINESINIPEDISASITETLNDLMAVILENKKRDMIRKYFKTNGQGEGSAGDACLDDVNEAKDYAGILNAKKLGFYHASKGIGIGKHSPFTENSTYDKAYERGHKAFTDGKSYVQMRNEHGQHIDEDLVNTQNWTAHNPTDIDEDGEDGENDLVDNIDPKDYAGEDSLANIYNKQNQDIEAGESDLYEANNPPYKSKVKPLRVIGYQHGKAGVSPQSPHMTKYMDAYKKGAAERAANKKK